MNNEEKLKEAKRLYKTATPDQKYVLESLFPELADSEDERIRKALIKGFNECLDSSSHYPKNAIKYWRGIVIEDILAWLEKQGKTITVDIDKMVDEFAHTEVKDYGTPSMIEVDAYRKGINDTLCLSLKLEKQGEQKAINQYDIEIPFGAKDSELIEESYYIPKGYHAEISKDKVTIKKGEQEPIEWKDSDEKYLFWALLSIQKDIAASEINGVNTKDLNDCVKWLYSLKRRIGG